MTICGFCGASVFAAPKRDSASSPRPVSPFGVGRAADDRGALPRWLLAVAVLALVVGVASLVGPKSDIGERHRPVAGAEDSSRPPAGRTSSVPEPVAGSASASPALAVRASHGRLTPDALRGLAAELERRAQAGPEAGLADLVDVNVRYQSAIVDAGELRELRAGAPELLAHWQVGWLAAEAGLPVPADLIAVEEVTVTASGIAGTVSRQIETTGNVARIAFPRPLLEALARRQPVDAVALEGLDLTSLVERPVDCRLHESIQVAATPIGIHVVAVERRGDCLPAD